jgi:hypothetical protein
MLDLLRGETVTIKTSLESEDPETGSVGLQAIRGTLLGSDAHYLFIGSSDEAKPQIVIPHSIVLSIELGDTVEEIEDDMGDPDTGALN